MSHWNYHLIKSISSKTNKPRLTIHEVYYDNDNNPQYFNPEPVALKVESVKEFSKLYSEIINRTIFKEEELQII